MSGLASGGLKSGGTPVSGSAISPSAIKVDDGSAGSPSIAFASDIDNGIYKQADNVFGINASGGLRITGPASDTNAIVIPGSGRIANAASAAWIRLNSDGEIAFNGTLATGVIRLNGFSLQAGSGQQHDFRANTANGSGAIAFKISNTTNLNTVGAKLLVFYQDDRSTETACLYSHGKFGHKSGDSSGTPGAATINQPCGKSAIASGAASVTITNNLCTANTLVQAWIQQSSTDASLTHILRTSASSGSFTIVGNANAASDVVVAWKLTEML